MIEVVEIEVITDEVACHNERVKMRANFVNALSIGLIGFAFLRPLAEGTLLTGWKALATRPDDVDAERISSEMLRAFIELERLSPTQTGADSFLYQSLPFSHIFEWIPMWSVWLVLGIALHWAAQRPLRRLRKEAKK